MLLAERFNKWIFALMDRIYLRPMWVKLGHGERVRMVRPKSRVLVLEALVRRGLVGLGIGIAAGLSLTLAVFVARAILNLPRYLETGNVGPVWVIFPTTVFLCTVPVLIYTFYIETWNCANAKHIFLSGTTFFLQTKAPEGTPTLSVGPTATVAEEVKMGSAGEAVEMENPTLLGRLWDGFLWRRRGIANITLLSRLFRGADQLEYIEWVFGVFKVLQFLAKEARERQGQIETAMKALWSARLDEAKEGEVWISATGDEVAEILRALNQLMPEGEAIDLAKVQDPGEFDVKKWHQGIGEVEAAVVRPMTLDLTAFPTVE